MSVTFIGSLNCITAVLNVNMTKYATVYERVFKIGFCFGLCENKYLKCLDLDYKRIGIVWNQNPKAEAEPESLQLK